MEHRWMSAGVLCWWNLNITLELKLCHLGEFYSLGKCITREEGSLTTSHSSWQPLSQPCDFQCPVPCFSPTLSSCILLGVLMLPTDFEFSQSVFKLQYFNQENSATEISKPISWKSPSSLFPIFLHCLIYGRSNPFYCPARVILNRSRRMNDSPCSRCWFKCFSCTASFNLKAHVSLWDTVRLLFLS